MEVTVHLDDALAAGITRNGEHLHGYIIEDELRNHDKLLRMSLNEIRGMFTHGEICLIADICNGYWYFVDNPKLQLYMEVHDGIVLNALDEKWQVDKEALLQKLRVLSQFQAHVIFSQVLRCWGMCDNVDNKLIDLLEEHFLSKGPKE